MRTFQILALSVLLSLPIEALADRSTYVMLHQVKESSQDFLNGTHGKIIVYETDDLISGNGKEFSDWYKFVSLAAPKGYRVLSSNLWVTGDRVVALDGDGLTLSKHNPPVVSNVFPMSVKRNGGWMEYMLFEKSDDHVVWGVSLQGHADRAQKQTVKARYDVQTGEGTLNLIFEDSLKEFSAYSRAHLAVTYTKVKASPPASKRRSVK